MNDTKHTPGPWKIIIDGTYSGRWPFIVRGEDEDTCCPIAELPVSELNDAGKWIPSFEAEEVLANARLMVAAPLLYESLREVLDDWENGLKPHETPSFQKALVAYQEAAQ